MKLPLILEIIWWQDACFRAEASDYDQTGEDYKLTDILSVGIFVHEDSKTVTIAQEDHFRDKEHRDRTTIPKVNIIKRKRIKAVINGYSLG